MAFEQEFGPLGPQRGDWQAALVAHTIAMVNRDKKSRRYRLRDFVLRWGDRQRRQSPQQMLAVLRAFAARQGKGGG